MTYIGCEEAGGGASEQARKREREAGGGVGEIPSAYQSVYLALRVPLLWEGEEGKAESKRGEDDTRTEGRKEGRMGCKKDEERVQQISVFAPLQQARKIKMKT